MIMYIHLLTKLKPLIWPLLLTLAVAVRVFLSIRFPAQSYDIGTYAAWGRLIINLGPAEFFAATWSDYLPLPIYFCALIYQLSTYFGLSFAVVFKMGVSLLEFVLIFFIHRSLSLPRKWLLVPFLFFSPAVLGDSAFWGQLDTIPALLTALSLILLSRRLPPALFSSAVFFGLAVALKPIMLLTLPVFIMLLINNFRSLLFFALGSFFTFLLTAFPVVGPLESFQFLLHKALEQSSTYPYTTINAWNLWSIRDLHNTWPPDSSSVLSLSAYTVGLSSFFVLAFFTLKRWRQVRFDPAQVYSIAATLLIIFYVFATRMHERHLFFGLPLLALAALSTPWLILPLTVLTLTFTLNLWGAYYWVEHNQSWPVSPLFIQVISWINVFTALLLVFVADLKLFLKSCLLKIKSHKTLLLILGIAMFLRLANLGHPPDYIFDEVYHAFTAREYLHSNIEAWEWWTTPPQGVAFEWTHPPVAKYGMVLGMLLFGENSFGWRVGSAVFGVISIYGLYRLSLALFASQRLALTAAFLLSIEGLHLSQSRIAMNDIYMLSFLIWSLFYAVRDRWKLASVLFGLALGSKWAAVYGFVPLFIIYLKTYPGQFNFINTFKFVAGGMRLVLLSLIIYVLTFTPFILIGHTWAQWWELHRQMWYYHTHLVATHTYQSTPLHWIFSLRPVWYHVEYAALKSNIYAQGNPAILWLGLVAAISLLPKLRQFAYYIVLSSYLIFFVPWIFSPRIMFFYHYLPSSAFLTLLLSAWLTTLPKRLGYAILIISTLSLILVSPLLFAIPIGDWYWNSVFTVFPSWK